MMQKSRIFARRGQPNGRSYGSYFTRSDFLQNGIRRIRTGCETTKEESVAALRNLNATPGHLKLKYAGIILPVLGIGVLSTMAFVRGPGSIGVVTSIEGESPALTCHYMTVSLLPEGKLSAEGKVTD
jgi:hypothetical protein